MGGNIMAQTTVALSQMVVTDGIFPGGSSASNLMGMILTSAAPALSFGLAANGALLAVSTNQYTYDLLGNSYGGDTTNFPLPDLVGRNAIGAANGYPGGVSGGALAVNYLIAVQGFAPPSKASGGYFTGMVVPYAGVLGLFLRNGANSPWQPCVNGAFSSTACAELYSLLGTTFGPVTTYGGQTHCARPDLAGVVPMGVGAGPAGAVALGEKVNFAGPAIGLNYLICTDGQYFAPPGASGPPLTSGFLGQVVLSAVPEIPTGWALADGSILNVAANPKLFDALGAAYGGDGVTTFALPDLRGRSVVGAP